MPPLPMTISKSNFVKIRAWMPRKRPARVYMLGEAQLVPLDYQAFFLRMKNQNSVMCYYKKNNELLTKEFDIEDFLQKGLALPKTREISEDQNLIQYLFSHCPADVPKSFGHVSLETTASYVSFWPKHYNAQTKQAYETPAFVHYKVNESYLRTLLYDQAIEHDEDYFEETLYTLDAVAIDQAFLRFKELNFNWSLWGGSVFSSKKTQNCSGLVSFLLYQGKIPHLNTSFSSMLKGAGYGALSGIIAGTVLPSVTSLYRFYKVNTTPSTLDRDLTTASGLIGTSLVAFFVGAGITLRLAKEDILKGVFLGLLAGAATGTLSGTIKITDAIATIPSDIIRIIKTAKRVESNKYDLMFIEDMIPDDQNILLFS